MDLFSPELIRLIVEIVGALVVSAVVFWLSKRLLSRGRLGELIEPVARRTIARSLSALALVVMAVLVLSARNEVIRQDLLLSTIAFLPKLVVGALILVITFVLSKLLGVLLEQTTRSRSPALAARVRAVTSASVLTVGVLIAMKQMGLATDVLVMMLGAVLVTVALSLGLGIGLGVLPLARQIAAGRHVEDRFSVGQRVAIRDVQGRIQSMGMASVRLVDDEGRTFEVPYGAFLTGPVGTKDD